MEPEEIEICRKAFTFIQRNRKAISQRRLISKVDTYEGSIQASQPIPPYDIKQDPEAIGVFEKLPQVIPDSIIEQVKKFKNSLHCIFIKNDDYDLTLGIVSYIYYTHANGSFTYLPYSGYTDQEIVSDLFPPDPPNKYKLDYYLRGRTLFISGIGSEHQSVFKRLLGAFKGINFSNPYGKEFGFLIINIDNIASVPNELLRLSDIINLEPEKPGIQQATTIELRYDKERHVLFTNEKHLQLTRDKKELISLLFSGRKHIDLLAEKIAESKGKNKIQYTQNLCRTLMNKTNSAIEKEFGVKKFICSESKKSGYYHLLPKPKEGILDENIKEI